MGTSRRELIRMTDDEVAAFVEARLSLQVGTIERDGSIRGQGKVFQVVDLFGHPADGGQKQA